MIKQLPNIRHAESGNFFLMAGPCAIEGEEMALRIAERIVNITDKLEIPYIFKGSYKKANRSRIDSFSGIGDEKALKVLEKVRNPEAENRKIVLRTEMKCRASTGE